MSATGERGGMVYAQAAAPSPQAVLEEIDELLQALGASKSNLLTARVLLPDMQQAAEFDSIWDAWLGQGRRPLRVCKLAAQRLVEITVTGLRMRASPSRSPHVQGRPSQG